MEGMRYDTCLKDFSRKYFKEKEELSVLDTTYNFKIKIIEIIC